MSLNRILGAGMGVGALMAGLVTVTAAPAAYAASDGTSYAAIAYSPTSGNARSVWNATSQLDAANDAVSGCNQRGHTTDCVVAAESNYCVALATMPDPNNNAPYSGGHAATLAAADQMALSGLAGSTIQSHQCNS